MHEPDRIRPSVREARDDDSETLIRLIAAVYAEYPGCILDVDNEEPHLRRPASAFREWGGRLLVAEEDGRPVACCGYRDRGGALELKHLYVARSARRQGLGHRLVAMVEEAARAAAKNTVELWSDSRFLDAHRLYESLGYTRGLRERELNDLSRSVEYYYSKRVN